MKDKKLWTESELEIVKKYYPIGGILLCQKFITRSKFTIRKKARELNVKLENKSRFPLLYDENNLKQIIQNSKSYSDIARQINYSRASAFNLVKKFALKYNIDLSHLCTRKQNLKKIHERATIPLEQILVVNSTYSRTSLKKRLYESGLKKRECEKCGQNEIWHGEKMSLILDHKNGIRDDNRLNNLQILCPNCNSTLPTHCGKNIKLKNRCITCGKKCSKNSQYCNLCYKTVVKNKIPIKIVDKINKTSIEIDYYINNINTCISDNQIDFTKFGWVTELSKKIGLRPQKINLFMKKHFNQFYEEKCFKRCNNKNIAIENKKIKNERKKNTIKNRQQRIQLILTSEIDYNQKGWLSKLAKKLNINKSVCLRWIKRNMNDFYLKHKH